MKIIFKSLYITEYAERCESFSESKKNNILVSPVEYNGNIIYLNIRKRNISSSWKKDQLYGYSGKCRKAMSSHKEEYNWWSDRY